VLKPASPFVFCREIDDHQADDLCEEKDVSTTSQNVVPRANGIVKSALALASLIQDSVSATECPEDQTVSGLS